MDKQAWTPEESVRSAGTVLIRPNQTLTRQGYKDALSNQIAWIIKVSDPEESLRSLQEVLWQEEKLTPKTLAEIPDLMVDNSDRLMEACGINGQEWPMMPEQLKAGLSPDWTPEPAEDGTTLQSWLMMVYPVERD